MHIQGPRIHGSKVQVYKVPTDAPEADGTFAWDSTTMVLVSIEAGDKRGIGYTYADGSTGKLVKTLLEKVVEGRAPFDHGSILQDLYRQVRNSGETGISSMAISAIDNALWDLRARLLDTSLVSLLGSVRGGIPVYGSGGFTSYDDAQLTNQLGGWAERGFSMVKMKVGTHPDDDLRRVSVARKAIGESTDLFVDANGAYTVAQALALAQAFAQASNVRWFEEPVSSDNLVGLSKVRARAPLGMDIAAGEYGYTAWYFDRMLKANAITVLQADATRCGGISGFLNSGALCWAANTPLSSHCGPSMHVHVCCAVPRAIHMEFFHDHVRIERMFFDGFCEPVGGVMCPDRTRPGMGLTLKEKDAERFLT
ncbi:mandelate racemase [Alloacidobacterium dinghuense]|uniref:Mandelate racemase n=1 Tax=Alloacidobacterium dinghuense TaxID=2763107 RepID=A0A7G8BHC6_9BACT|nr:enolase C-terminal domain-like protein [Alloacidobacterium dinghuense]QNI31946.1 mandelate racemase [Alloacidobacterium dinghuense]